MSIALSSFGSIAAFPRLSTPSPIIGPETVIRWHRCWLPGLLAVAIAQACWQTQVLSRVARSHSRDEPGELTMGAPRIHGELLKLGFEVAQSTVAKYMVRRRGPPSQGWKTFLRNHAPHVGAIDLFVVPTAGFKLVYGLVTHRAPATASCLGQCHDQSDGRLDRPSDHRGLPLGAGAPLPDPRQGHLLWSRCDTPSRCHGHSGPTNGAAVALAEWMRSG